MHEEHQRKTGLGKRDQQHARKLRRCVDMAVSNAELQPGEDQNTHVDRNILSERVRVSGRWFMGLHIGRVHSLFSEFFDLNETDSKDRRTERRTSRPSPQSASTDLSPPGRRHCTGRSYIELPPRSKR